MKRRGFIAALAGLPLIGSLVSKQEPEKPKPVKPVPGQGLLDHMDTYLGPQRHSNELHVHDWPAEEDK